MKSIITAKQSTITVNVRKSSVFNPNSTLACNPRNLFNTLLHSFNYLLSKSSSQISTIRNGRHSLNIVSSASQKEKGLLSVIVQNSFSDILSFRLSPKCSSTWRYDLLSFILLTVRLKRHNCHLQIILFTMTTLRNRTVLYKYPRVAID